MSKQSLKGDIHFFETKDGLLKLKVMNLSQQKAIDIAMSLEDWNLRYRTDFEIKQTNEIFRVVLYHNAVCDLLERGKIICSPRALQRAKEIQQSAAKQDSELPAPYIVDELADGIEVITNLDFPRAEL